MEKFVAWFKDLWATFQTNTGAFAAILGLLLYFFNSARNRYDALVKARIEAHDKKMEEQERNIDFKIKNFGEKIEGHKIEMIFLNAQIREALQEINKKPKRKKK